MNHITIAGRIGKDPEMRYLKDGDPVLSFSVADDQGKDKPLLGGRAVYLASEPNRSSST